MSDVDRADALALRRQSLETSGWGNRVRWWQPRNACWWLFVLVLAYGLYRMLDILDTTVRAFGSTLGLSALIFGAYGLLFWWFTTVIDRYSPQPVSLRVAAFAWGGIAATWVIAVSANDALRGLYLKLLGQQAADVWWAPLSAPFTEELGKGAGVLLLLFIAPTVVRTAYDGFVLGAFAGLGFQIFEDVLYALNSAQTQFGSDPIGNSLGTVGLRVASGFTSHILYSAVFGAGLVYLVGTRAQRRRVGLGLGLCAAAMALHFLWDAVGALSGGNGPLSLVLIVVIAAVAIATVVGVFHLTVRDERRTMRTVMSPEVLDGTLTAEELDALSGGWRQRRRYRKGAAGRRDRRHRKHRLAAAHDLADEIAAADARETERVAFARAELARLGRRPLVDARPGPDRTTPEHPTGER
ncbi:PrsW family intramembrane metalloprotease [Cellulosimicrobium sp. NPDC057862]|uniref:PrsW family intramembrane metalloprotease n=1 Tax=Cellulosimicrobium sp. NPDC057862 TaxID=3346266 RepID=UPI003671DA67